ncbi:MAG: tetratricopeptide repeat protein [Acidobacteriaceae bacterium]
MPVARSASTDGPNWDGRLVLVLSFENQSAQPGLDWIGASFPTILDERLNSAGFLTLRREDRQYALQHLGLPAGLHPTHATIYRIAQMLDADYVVLGSYSVANGQVTAVARVLAMHAPAIDAPLQEKAGLDQLLDVENGLAWQIARQIDPHFAVDKQTFLAAGHGIRLDAFENYIRGQTEAGLDERIRHLNAAVQIAPEYAPALLALGKAYFDNQQYGRAIDPLAKVPSSSPRAQEAGFYLGLACLYTGNYSRAESAFAAVAAVLPLPEVLNNQGIALNRRGQDGTALFERAVTLDPQNANYWFNLAVSERRVRHFSRALEAVKKSLALRPEDKEAQQLQAHLLAEEKQPGQATVTKISRPNTPGQTTSPVPNSSGPASAGDTNDDDAYEPLERIERKYNETSFRQAAFAMDQMRALKLQSLPPAQQAVELCKEGQGYVDQGLLLEAERQFQQALLADPKSAPAHAGLAQVREYTGNATAAREQANTSLQLQPNVPAYLVLARLDLQQRQFAAASGEVQKALQLAPRNSAANGILQAIQIQEKQTP